MVKTLKYLIMCVVLWIFVSCAGIERRMQQEENKESDKPQENVEVSLSEDRSQFTELRKDIPKDVRRKNDELAYLLNLLREDRNIDTSSVRSRFNREIRKRRDIFTKGSKRQRDEFTRKQKKDRSDFLKRQKSSRESFNRSTKDRDERSQFFSEQDQERRTFFSDQRDKSSAFREEQNQRRRNFDQEMREKQKEFNDLIREYDRRRRERKNALRTEKNMQRKQSKIIRNAHRQGLTQEDLKAIQDFQKIPPGPGVYLGVPEGK